MPMTRNGYIPDENGSKARPPRGSAVVNRRASTPRPAAPEPRFIEIDREVLYHMANHFARKGTDLNPGGLLLERIMLAAERIVAATEASKPPGTVVRLELP